MPSSDGLRVFPRYFHYHLPDYGVPELEKSTNVELFRDKNPFGLTSIA
jgi:hypothetical protein